MKRGLKATWMNNRHNNMILQIVKKRGKLTLDEICDLLRCENNQLFNGRYAILLNCTEATIGGNGMWDESDEKGDAVDLYPISVGDRCPVCGELEPPFDYCPSCGAAWRDMDNNVEKLIADMKDEAIRNIENPNTSAAAKVAWYWTHIGALDMARQLGFITDERRQALCDEVQYLKERLGNRDESA